MLPSQTVPVQHPMLSRAQFKRLVSGTAALDAWKSGLMNAEPGRRRVFVLGHTFCESHFGEHEFPLWGYACTELRLYCVGFSQARAFAVNCAGVICM